MKDSIRFPTPVEVPRPRGSRLLEAHSPRLGRRVRFYDFGNFAQWIRLEADPTVVTFCERPTYSAPVKGAAVLGFWVRWLEADEEFQVLIREGATTDLPPVVDSTAVRAIAPAELVAASIWIENWQRMLPLITATSGVRPKGLKKSLLHFVTEPMALSRIERHFSSEDPMLARSQVFDLLRIGKLASPGLHTERLSFHTLFGPAR